MTKIEMELSDATATAAREAGLLTPEALERLLTDAIKRRQAADALLAIADRVAEADIEPMSIDEIDREVKAVRAERRQAADALLAIGDRVTEAGIEPMSIDEIDREVKAVRAERRRRAGGR